MVAIPVQQIEPIAVALLDLAETLERPLLASEQKNWRWILHAFESESARKEMLAMDQDQIAYYSGLIEKLVDVLDSPVSKQILLKRERPEAQAERNDGNFSLKQAPFQGVSIRRMTAAEATERVELISRLATGITTLARELSLVRQRDAEEAAAIARASRRIARMAKAFAARCQAAPEIPSQRSIEEIMADMATMNRLMSPAPVEGEE